MVIENNQLIKLTTRFALNFFDAVKNSPAPNEKLSDAMKAYM